MTNRKTLWHTLSSDDTLKTLDSSSEGLTSKEVEERILQYGRNEIETKEKTPWWKLLLDQFIDLLIIILIVAAVISALIGQMVEAIAIIIIVILAGVLGFIQEFQAGKAIESLQKMAAPNATALRNGIETIIPASELVPGDIIILATGDKIPADSRIIEAKNLKIDEAALTGESLPVEKISKLIDDDEAPIGDRVNLLFKGTSVTYGRGKAVVVSTGMETELGKIAKMIQTTENRKTPLQANLDELGKKIGIFAIILAALMSVVGILRGYEFVEMFVWGVALAVAVIPEALPAVVTISIALGVRRMVKRKALIRKLPAVETLGSTNIICSDKTGTLTQDQMTIRKIWVSDKIFDVSGSGYSPDGEFSLNGSSLDPQNEKDLMKLLQMGTLCNDTVLKKEDGKWEILGDPTEGSIAVTAKKAGINIDEYKNQFPRIDEIPFSSESKRMSTIHDMDGGRYSYSKGAPEVIIESCSKVIINEQEVDFTDEMRNKVLLSSEQMSTEALRVLALGYKKIGSDENASPDIEKNLVFAGLFGMIDPPRPEVRDAIKLCEHAGIKPIMITGDHQVTAVAVAKELGIMKGGKSISGRELERMTDEELDVISETTEVYARISPEHKMRIVTSLMNKGNIVAMTGDGVNDAPSLKKADIGVAMGIKGTDVSREAADMILTDDNFASIVSAIEEGRSIFENIRKYLVYLLSGNLGTIIAMIVALFAALPIPLIAVQILFINFLMDGLIAIALGVEPSEAGIMEKQPRKVEEGILNKKMLTMILGIGVWIGIVTIAIFIWALESGASEKEAVTIFFVTLILARLFNGINCRSFEHSIFQMNFLSNKSLIGGIILSLISTFLVLQIPVLKKAFHTLMLSGAQWLIMFGVASLVWIMFEIWKAITRKSASA
ncbi:MAG: cation-translocating P-type ATPase [Melioribacteraceae bacterium]|nr:cation-translocating P-type ATPase [Melioribacteraceae bacterium]MCF8354215.1 cation-translocating P-type ATPase [Melioribacteraceae bacterium]MCF8392861.1 cation-translocating P-type ATPase [Melioribacteraceae bacterium]MCF8418653.1 cation-translocating P-type ATPase [Melioribacteraceae bacterium]